MKKRIDQVNLGGLKKLEVEELVSDNDTWLYKGDEDPSTWKHLFLNFDVSFSGEEVAKNSKLLENTNLADKWVHL